MFADPEASNATSDRLLSAAASLFRQKGYSASTTREIAALLGINKASLYHHIKGKEDLLFNLSVESLNHIHTEVARAIAVESDPVRRLRAFIRTHVVTMLADQDKHAAMLIELRSLTGRRRKAVVQLRDDYEVMLQGVMSEGQRQHALRDDIEARLLAVALLNLLNWTIFWFEPGRGLAADALGDVLAKIYLQGVLISAD